MFEDRHIDGEDGSWNGNVHYLKYTGKHNSDNDTPSSSIVNSSSFRACLQFHMRHLDPRRAFHQMVLRRYITGLQRRSLDCCAVDVAIRLVSYGGNDSGRVNYP